MIPTPGAVDSYSSPGAGRQKLGPVTVNVVRLREDHPPAGEEPVEWVLVTTLPIGTLEQAPRL